MNPFRSVLLWTSRNRWIEEQFRKRSFARLAVSRFLPGENVEAALKEALRLQSEGIDTIVTHLGENLTSLSEAQDVVDHYLEVMPQIQAAGLSTPISPKLTQLGLDLDRDAAEAHLDTLLTRAGELGAFVWIDMEDSSYVDVTLDVVLAARKNHSNIGVALQAYLYRTPEDLTRLLAADMAVRLVKGAYMEPASVAFPKKRDTDQAYFQLAERMVAHGPTEAGFYHGIGTHDRKLLASIREVAARMDGDGPRFEVQMIYGVEAAEQKRLADDGVPVRVLISYGESWFPWYVRRLAERPANVGFVLRSMFKG